MTAGAGYPSSRRSLSSRKTETSRAGHQKLPARRRQRRAGSVGLWRGRARDHSVVTPVALNCFVILLPRGGWKHRVSHPSRDARSGTPPWGGAERNPRMTKRKKTERAKRAITQKLRFTLRGLFLCTPTILGFRSAPPQALCCRPYSRAQPKLHQLVQRSP